MKKTISYLAALTLLLLTSCVIENSSVTTSSPSSPSSNSTSNSTSEGIPPQKPTGEEDNMFSNNTCDELKVYFIEVAGQYGDAILATCGDFSMVIDAGGGSGNSKDGSLLKKYVDEKAGGEIDLLIMTHDHQDHIGGTVNLFGYDKNNPTADINDFDIDLILDYGYTGTSVISKSYSAIRQKEISKGTNYCRVYDSVRDVGTCSKTLFLAPNLTFEILDTEMYVNYPTTSIPSDVNSTSVTGILTYDDFSLFLSGDLDVEGEHKLLANGELDQEVTVMKAGHHCSDTANSAEIIDVLNPKAVIISAAVLSNGGTFDGGNNDHPHPTALNRIYAGKRIEDNVYLNMTNGTLLLTATGDSDFTIAGVGSLYYKNKGISGEENLKLHETYFFNNITMKSMGGILKNLVTIPFLL